MVGGHAGYAVGYPKMGHALQTSGRDIVYSCSWPAYMGSNESTKPFEDMIKGGCNLWRNWHDIQGNWHVIKAQGLKGPRPRPKGPCLTCFERLPWRTHG
eukprot:SAG11_NODE_1650_length_4510_cov_6.795738_5_plen_99_part_00